MRGALRVFALSSVVAAIALFGSAARAQEYGPDVITKVELPPNCACMYEDLGVVVVKDYSGGPQTSPGQVTPGPNIPDPVMNGVGLPTATLEGVEGSFAVPAPRGGGPTSSPEQAIRRDIKRVIRQLG
jgi:hypothetical protein